MHQGIHIRKNLGILKDTRFFAQTQEGLLHFRKLGRGHGLTADKQQRRVFPKAVLMQAVRLAQQAFDAVARDGAAEFLARSEADTAAHGNRRKDIQHKIPIGKGASCPVHTLEITAPFDDPSSR